MSVTSLQYLPAELVLLIFNSLTRLQDAVSLARTCKKAYALFARLEDRGKIICSIVENATASLPQKSPSKAWLELHFPPGTPFWIPRSEQLPSGLEDEETITFLTTIGFPVFECGMIHFESTGMLPLPSPAPVRRTEAGSKGESDTGNDNGDSSDNNDNNDNNNDDGNRDAAGALGSATKEDELERQLQSSDDSEAEQEREQTEPESDSEEEELLFLGTWYSQSIALEPSSGSILHHSWDSPDESEVIADSVGRFLVLLGVIRSVVCGLRECGLQPEQRTEHAEVEEVVLESLFEGLGRVDGYVREAGVWGWICNYLSS
ncbi:hypothetical protein HK57_00710 [Aspergillus ustus]|uniref:F-box domain-containing protein n=1 Tax=Aspergillus ustus TaxID=40382 RepID=A0A0C1BVE6_ASPUT|nr:hypothetical protein HK57_00710 [Aspergillus ustus]